MYLPTLHLSGLVTGTMIGGCIKLISSGGAYRAFTSGCLLRTTQALCTPVSDLCSRFPVRQFILRHRPSLIISLTAVGSPLLPLFGY